MTDTITDTSAIYKFSLNKHFFEDINKPLCFSWDRMNTDSSSPKDTYKILLLSKCIGSEGIYNEMLDANHCLKHSEDGTLLFDNEGYKEVAFTNYSPDINLIFNSSVSETNTLGFIVSLNNDMFTLELPSTDNYVKAMILYNERTKYMMAYTILEDNLILHNQQQIPMTGGLTSVSEEE